MKSPKPYSTGRTVLYVPTEADNARDKNFNRTSPLPATIVNPWLELSQYVDEGRVNLKVLTDGPGDIWATSVAYSDSKEPGTWHWPEIK